MMHDVKNSADEYEINFATNTLGTFALTEMLLPALKTTEGSRVVTVSSGGMYTASLILDDLQGDTLKKKNQIDGTTQYARNKRHQVALTEYWSRKHPGIFWSAMHPGTVHIFVVTHQPTNHVIVFAQVGPILQVSRKV